ncbi:MAG: hypothetical protein HOV81_05555 [Kofleriaceae bacterium]|nr:hypothetical protein [Kofleriaceae bacterium]
MFHVFVEGATDGSPAGLQRLADAMSAHYGIPAPDLMARLSKGRFRVKGNTDRATADSYVRDLTRLGARCTIEEAQPAQRLTPTPFPAMQPKAPPAPTTPPQRTSSPAIPGGQQYQSGLAAAFSGEQPVASLGALEGDNIPLSLSSVDGADDRSAPVSTSSFGPPPDGGMSASIGPPAAKPKTDKIAKQKPKDEPLDMFAPPDAQEAAFSVDIADDEKDFSARKRASTPPANVPVAPQPEPTQPLPRASTPAMRKSAPSIQPANEPIAPAPAPKKSGLANPDHRFIAGVLLALGLGFVPAHFVGKMREESAYEAIDRKVIAAQQLAETPEQYALLDKMRADQLAKKYSEKRNAAIIAILVWAVVAGGVAFVWFKKIDWERFD